MIGPSPAFPFMCPRCHAPASASPAPQVCTACRGKFALYPGAASDPSVVPPPPTNDRPVKVRSAGVFSYRFGLVEAFGVAEGELDPVVAMLPTNKNGVAWPDILSIAVWRVPDWVELVVATLVPVPLAVLFLALSFGQSPGFLVLAVPFSLLGGFMLHRALKRRRHFLRVVGRYGVVTLRFDRPGWRRARFHREVLRRAGLRDAAIP